MENEKEQIMRKLWIMLLVLCPLLLIGCSGYDAQKCYDTVKNKFPDAEISLIPGKNYQYLVRLENGDILYIENLNSFNTDITTEFLAFRGK